MSWMCQEQTAVSHSSTESDFISLDSGLRMYGLFALDLWDMVIEVSRSIQPTTRPNPNIQVTRHWGSSSKEEKG